MSRAFDVVWKTLRYVWYSNDSNTCLGEPFRMENAAQQIHAQQRVLLVLSKYNYIIRYQGVTKRCRLSWLTNSALVYEPKSGEGGGGVTGSQPMSTAVHRSPNKRWRSNSIFNLCKISYISTGTWSAETFGLLWSWYVVRGSGSTEVKRSNKKGKKLEILSFEKSDVFFGGLEASFGAWMYFVKVAIAFFIWKKFS